MSEGGLGKIVSESFDEFTLFGLSGFSEELAEVEIVGPDAAKDDASG